MYSWVNDVCFTKIVKPQGEVKKKKSLKEKIAEKEAKRAAELAAKRKKASIAYNCSRVCSMDSFVRHIFELLYRQKKSWIFWLCRHSVAWASA